MFMSSSHMHDRKITLSIVIIGRNEEKNIARCIESAIIAGDALSGSYEIIFVDSASTDESVAIAGRYPVKIVHIKPGEWRCAAAGRTIGARLSAGDHIAFIDGDMTVDREWFIKGLLHLQQGYPKVGLVTGGKEYVDIESEVLLKTTQQYDHVQPVKRFGGSAIVERCAFDEAGGFDPYLISNEEADLSDRLLCAGYTLIGIPAPMIRHYGLEPGIEETIRRGNYGYYIGLGQYIRRLCSRGASREALLKIKVQLVFVTWFVSFVLLSGFGVGSSSWICACASLATLVSCWLAFVVRLRSITNGTRMFCIQPFIIRGLIKGIGQRPNRKDYTPSIDITTGRIAPGNGPE